MKSTSMTNKKIVTHILTVTILCVSVAFLFTFFNTSYELTSYKTQTVVITEPRVYVTTYGNCYHNVHCSYLSKSQIPIGEQHAIKIGYYACSRCGGHSSGTIEVTYTKQVAIDEYNLLSKIVCTIVQSVLFTLLLFLIISSYANTYTPYKIF